MNVKPLEISKEKAIRIMSWKAPSGLFYFKEKNVFVGIDNSNGNCLTKKFEKLEECVAWLHHESPLQESASNSFEITITEKMIKTITVNADYYEEARQKVIEAYDREDFDLDYIDCSYVNIG